MSNLEKDRLKNYIGKKISFIVYNGEIPSEKNQYYSENYAYFKAGFLNVDGYSKIWIKSKLKDSIKEFLDNRKRIIDNNDKWYTLVEYKFLLFGILEKEKETYIFHLEKIEVVRYDPQNNIRSR